MRHVGVPDRAGGVDRDAVRRVSPRLAKTRRPPSDPSAAMSNAVSRLPVGLGDDQRSVVRRDRHAVGKVQIIGDKAGSPVTGTR